MLAGGFDEVHEKLEWNGWMLQHHPIATNRKLLCGHIHEKWTRIGWVINVGVDVWDFTPRTIEELVVAEESSAKEVQNVAIVERCSSAFRTTTPPTMTGPACLDSPGLRAA